MTDIKPYIRDHLLEPLKNYPTIMQETMIELISQKLQSLYDYTFKFPEIISPTQSRMDILNAIASQFSFNIREEANLQEQVDILDKILYIYRKRGSVDTIENMWKYYGGDLPKEVNVVIPSYSLFRYSKSKLSGNHVFQDNEINRSGVYEINLINNTYPVEDLREFLLKELVAAGNYIYFSNSLHMDVTSENDSKEYPNYFYKYYIVDKGYTLLDIKADIVPAYQGISWSGIYPMSPNPDSRIYNTKIFSKESIEYMTRKRDYNDSLLSGRSSIYLDFITLMYLADIDGDYNSDLLLDYKPLHHLGDDGIEGVEGIYALITKQSDKMWYQEYYEVGLGDVLHWIYEIDHNLLVDKHQRWRTEICSSSLLYCTPSSNSVYIARNLYDREGNLIESSYPGYFVIRESLLGEALN